MTIFSVWGYGHFDKTCSKISFQQKDTFYSNYFRCRNQIDVHGWNFIRLFLKFSIISDHVGTLLTLYFLVSLQRLYTVYTSQQNERNKIEICTRLLPDVSIVWMHRMDRMHQWMSFRKVDEKCANIWTKQQKVWHQRKMICRLLLLSCMVRSWRPFYSFRINFFFSDIWSHKNPINLRVIPSMFKSHLKLVQIAFVRYFKYILVLWTQWMMYGSLFHLRLNYGDGWRDLRLLY